MKNGTGGLSLQQMHKQNLKMLDVRPSVPWEEGPLTESQSRVQKFQYYEKRCSEVADGLFLGSDVVARDREVLRDHGITHVVNCVGFLYPEYFKDELSYKTLYLQDTPAEDILCVLHDVLEFIDKARSSNGHVLVHCSQGVSRSVSLAIAYLMWKSDQPYDEVFPQVKAKRAIASPNIGFTVQLMNWHKRRTQRPHKCRIYRIAPHCNAAPLYLVLKNVQLPSGVNNTALQCLDQRGVFIVHTPDAVYLWCGSRSTEAFLDAATSAAELLGKYEGAPYPPILVDQGFEPEELLTSLEIDESLPREIDSLTPKASTSSYTSPFSNASTQVPSSTEVGKVDAYTSDYELFAKHTEQAESSSELPAVCLRPLAVRHGVLNQEGATPESPASLEGRMRKYRRSDSERWELDKMSRAPSAPYSDWPTISLGTKEEAPKRSKDDSSLH